MEQLKLQVSGMSCGGCVNSVTKALQAVPGVAEVKVTLESGEVQVSGTPDAAACKAAIESAGFDVVS
ncbi:MAG: hypothetical protein RL210_2162 [Pseudomonadota bacterium]|jgi:copper chaperone|nr:copper chaperone [Pseudomonadota bacterium]